MAPIYSRVDLRYATVAGGVLFVMICGDQLMLMLLADSWDSLDQVLYYYNIYVSEYFQSL